MATNTGRTIAATYKNLLNIDNSNTGVDSSLRTVQDGEGTASALQLSQSAVNINGTLYIGGAELTANVSALNVAGNNTDAITSINSVLTSVAAVVSTNTTNIAAVSALISANTAAIASVSSALETRIAAVSVLTSVNAAAIASVSTALETRINAVSVLASVNTAAIASVSAALESRINAVSVLASINTAAIASVSTALESRINAVSVLASVNTAAIASVSTALETRINAVSVLASVNTAAITSVSTALETRINAVSVLASTNAAAITSVSTALETRINTVSALVSTVSAAMAASVATRFAITGGEITGAVTISGSFNPKSNVYGVRTSLTDAASIAISMASSNHFIVQLGGNRTLEAPTNIQPTQTGSIIIIQDGTGSRTLSFNSVWKFPASTAPTLSTPASTVDRIDFEVYTSSVIHAVATLKL